MHQLPSSYRDNNGYVFEHGGNIFRWIRPQYFEHFNAFIDSGLYNELAEKNLLVAHREIINKEFDLPEMPEGKVIFPDQVPFISYPYEWSFDMWKDAALLTLQIAEASLQKNMILKDATPFNVQFFNGKPIFIDTLSFEKYQEGKTWVAYRQFCESFLAPLLLMHYCHPDTNKLFSVYPGGIPLSMLVTLLPKRSMLNLNVFLHIYTQHEIATKAKGAIKHGNFSKKKVEVLIRSLSGFVNKLSPKKVKSAWDDYYSGTILGDDYLTAKTLLVTSFLKDIQFNSLIDLGANEGHFSVLFKDRAKEIISIDADANAVNDLYLTIKNEKIKNILPLIINFTAPSPSIGWNNNERTSLKERLKGDVILALALVHHLAIAYNLPLQFIADWLATLGKYLVIEFVPKSDEKVKLLLKNREDIFEEYSAENFRQVFLNQYEIVREEKVGGTDRILFLMKKK